MAAFQSVTGSPPPTMASGILQAGNEKLNDIQTIASGIIQTGNEKLNNLVNNQQELTKSFDADSHDLAHSNHEIKGEAQKQPIFESGTNSKDLGWHKDLPDMPEPLIGGVTNENLFAMIRRFNKVSTLLAPLTDTHLPKLTLHLGCLRRTSCTSEKDDRARSHRGLGR
jgi:hypothetical protein